MHKSKMSKLVYTFNSYWIYDGYMYICIWIYNLQVDGFIIYTITSYSDGGPRKLFTSSNLTQRAGNSHLSPWENVGIWDSNVYTKHQTERWVFHIWRLNQNVADSMPIFCLVKSPSWSNPETIHRSGTLAPKGCHHDFIKGITLDPLFSVNQTF